MKQRIFYILFLLVSLTVFGQNYTKNKNLIATPTDYQADVVNNNDLILKYQEFLKEETQLHRAYTQEYYSMILKLFSVITIVFGAILTWLGWKTKKDIDNQVKQRIQELIIEFIDKNKKDIEAKNKALENTYNDYLKLYGRFLDANFLKCTKCTGFTSHNENKGTETNPICKICAEKIVKQYAENVSDERNIVEN